MGKLKTTTGIKNIPKILFLFLTGVALLLLLSYAVLKSPYIQTRLVRYVTEYIERTTGASIQIGGVDFRPMKSLVLNDVLLRDFQKDTLLYCKDLSVKIDSFSFVKKSFTIKEILLDQAYFNLLVMRGEDGGVMNIEMFLDTLQGKQKPQQPIDTLRKTTTQPGWLVGLQKISVRNSRFVYIEDEQDIVDYGVNWTNIDCRKLNVDVTGFHFGEEESGITISGLSLVEKSGLEIKELKGKAVFKDGNMIVTESKIVLARSQLDLIKLEYNWTPDQHDWRNFVTKMQQYYEVGPSYISFIDLAYFNGILRGIDNTVRCSGIVSNTVSQIEGRDLYIEIGNKSVLQGQFKSVGLPDFRNTVFDIDIHNAHLNPEDLASIYLPWFSMHIPVPEPLFQLQYIDFEHIGFNGILEDFTLEAQSVTPSLQGDLKFIYTPAPADPINTSDMTGEFNFTKVDAGKFAATGLLGNAVVTGKYTGQLSPRGTIFNVDSKFSTLNIAKGQLKNLGLSLAWANQKLNVVSTVKNDSVVNANLEFVYDLSDSVQVISAEGALAMHDLGKFGLSYLGKKESLHLGFDLFYAGKEAKNSFSNLTLSDIHYANTNGAFEIPVITVENTNNNRYNTINLHSDVADLFIDGSFKEIRPTDFLSKLLRSYLPAYAEKGTKRVETFKMDKIDFQYSVDIKDMNRVLKVLYPDLRVSHGAQIYSHFRHGDDQINLTMLADTIQYKTFRLIKSKVDVKGDIEKLNIIYALEQLKFNDAFQLYNVRNELTLENNLVHDKLTWCNWARQTYSGELAANVYFIPDEKNNYRANIHIYPGVIMLADSVWRMKQSNILIDGKRVDINNFSIARNDQYLLVKGRISENPEDKLSIELNRFNLAEAFRMLLGNRLPLFGEATGGLVMQDFYKDRMFTSDFDVAHWGVGQDTLGTLKLRSYWDPESRSLVLGAENRIDGITPLTLIGYYIPATDTVNIDIKLSEVKLNRLGNHVTSYISETGGGLSGKMNITGTLKQPDISGFVHLDSVAMKVNSLNARFFINDRIHIVKNNLVFDNLKIKDAAGKASVLNGNYQFWENKYDMNVKLENFLLLNTDYSHNESFYGKAYISGMIGLDNRNGQSNIRVNARTESGSRLFIPLTAGLTEEANNFLHFVNTGQSVRRRPQVITAGNNINLDANLEVNDNLEMQVIFDPTVGDILKSTGKGNIKIALDKDGSLNMFGEYKITKGDYLFTLSNLLNKKFILTPGGTVSWSGSPYDAMLNISAVYNLKTSLHELMPSSETNENTNNSIISDNGKKVPVECILNLSDNLTNPLVKFDINFPSLETQSRSYIQGLFSSQDEINKQMFSLLVLNKFYQTDNNATNNFGEQAGAAGVTTITEMMSSQLSRWLSQISNNIDVGLSYRMGDEITTDEIEVALSTQLLNDRITLAVNGNMDVGDNKNVTTEKNSNARTIAGDFDLDVKLNQQGTLKLKAYSHSDEKIIYNNTEMIQGVGVSYQESFDTLRELIHKYFGFLSRRKKNVHISKE